MRTFLQTINDFASEYIRMPLKRFFLYISIALFAVMIAVALLTPLSVAKFIAIAGLYGTSMITALLSFANYQLDAIVEVEIGDEMPVTKNTPDTKQDDTFVA